MAITKLVAGAEGSPTNSTGAVVASSVNAAIDLAEKGNVRNVGSLKDLLSFSAELVDGQKFDVTGFYAGTGVGGGVFVWDASKDKADHNGGTVIAPEALTAWDGTRLNLDAMTSWGGAGSGCFVRLSIGLDRRAEWFGVQGDYDPTTNPNVNDTKQIQALFGSVDHNCSIYGFGDMRLVRDNATVKTIESVPSYLCTIEEKHNVTIKSGFKIHQKHHATLDCVGVGFYKCLGLNLEMPKFDGGFKYTSATPINYKQQLLHLIKCDGYSGGFTVKNSSNVGFLLSNHYSNTATESQVNNSVLHTVISENCFQNSTFGSGVSRLTINNLTSLNAIGAAIKISSRFSGTGVGAKGIRIDNLISTYDDNHENPLNEAGTNPNSYLVGFDAVGAMEDISIGFAHMDFENTSIASIAVKQYPLSASLTTLPNKNINIGTLVVRNQSIANSSVYEGDNESVSLIVGAMDLQDISKAIQVSDVVTDAATQPRENKFINVGAINCSSNNRALINITDLNADKIYIGSINQSNGGSFQSVNVTSTCDLNHVMLPSLNITSTISASAKINKSFVLNGYVDSSSVTSDPVTINPTVKSGRLDYSLHVKSDQASPRRVYINNISDVSVGDHSLTDVQLGFVIDAVDSFNVSASSPKYSNLTSLQPFTFNTLSSNGIGGTIEHTGSPNSTLIADAGAVFKAKEVGGFAGMYIKYEDAVGGDRSVGWRKFSTN